MNLHLTDFTLIKNTVIDKDIWSPKSEKKKFGEIKNSPKNPRNPNEIPTLVTS